MKELIEKIRQIAEGLGWKVRIHPQDPQGDVEVEFGTDDTFVVKVTDLSLINDVADDIRAITNIAKEIYDEQRSGRVYKGVEQYLNSMLRLEKALRDS